MLDSRLLTSAAELTLAWLEEGLEGVSCVCSLSSCSGSLIFLPSLLVVVQAVQAGSLVTDLQGSHLLTVLAIHPLLRQILRGRGSTEKEEGFTALTELSPSQCAGCSRAEVTNTLVSSPGNWKLRKEENPVTQPGSYISPYLCYMSPSS